VNYFSGIALDLARTTPGFAIVSRTNLGKFEKEDVRSYYHKHKQSAAIFSQFWEKVMPLFTNTL
jgi:hypothetical protein